MIQIRELYKYYGDRRVLGPLSATIESGEVVGLLGRNGAGKTTTLRILACDLLPTSGVVEVDGVDVVDNPDEVRANVGYLPDQPPLYGDMTVHEYLRYAGRLRGVNKQVERHVKDAEDLTELGDVRHQLIATLSHGFKQRVGIAQAVVHKPKLVVLDEPISGLDPAQIVEMRQLVRNLRGDHTVVVSSHILSEISETCDRILLIRDGEIVAAGSEAELASQQHKMRVNITVRGKGTRDQLLGTARSAALGIDGVLDVQVVDTTERDDDLCSLQVITEKDVREALCRALVMAEVGVLELARSERELESLFIELSASRSSANGRSGKDNTQGKPAANEVQTSDDGAGLAEEEAS